jgi:hypothetical protein
MSPPKQQKTTNPNNQHFQSVMKQPSDTVVQDFHTMLTKGDQEKTKEKMLTKMFALARIMARTLRGNEKTSG